MATTTRGDVEYADAGDTDDVPATTLAIANSLDARVVGYRATIAERNSDNAALITASKRGMVDYVHAQANGRPAWFGHDGSDWQRFTTRADSQTGRADQVANSNGIIIIDHDLGTANIAVVVTPIHNGSDAVSEAIGFVIQEVTNANFQVKAWNQTNGGSLGANLISVFWRAEVMQ